MCASCDLPQLRLSLFLASSSQEAAVLLLTVLSALEEDHDQHRMSTPASSTLSIPLSQTTTLSPKHQALCRRSGLFNLAQVLCKSPLELRSILRLSSVQDAEWILDQLAAEGCETRGAIRFGFDARDKGKGRERDSNDDHDAAEGQVSTGDCHLDRMLRGGLTAGMLTELVGER